LTFFNTERISAKDRSFPGRFCQNTGILRSGRTWGGGDLSCEVGELYLYVPGELPHPRAKVPEAEKNNFTVWHEIIMGPGDQYIVPPQIVHWFQAGPGRCGHRRLLKHSP
jgi:hypothetical protein